MTEVTTPDPGAPRLGLLSRIAGVILSPRDAYSDIAAYPRWLGVLMVTIVLSAAGSFWFQSTEVGKKVARQQIDTTLETVEQLTGRQMTEQEYQQAIANSTSARARYTSVATIAVSFPIIVVILAAILLGVFNGILGGKARFKQVAAVVAFSGVIWTLATLFGLAMAAVRGDVSGATRLSVFTPGLETGFLAHFLSAIDLFWIWAFVNLAIGLAVLYRRRTGPIAVSFVTIYVVCGALYAAVRSMFSGA